MLARSDGDLELAVFPLRRLGEHRRRVRLHALWDMVAHRLGRGRAPPGSSANVVATEARTALGKAWEHGDRRITCWCLVLLARAALARGESVLAGRLWGATGAELEETGVLDGDDDLPGLTKALRNADDPGFTEGVVMVERPHSRTRWRSASTVRPSRRAGGSRRRTASCPRRGRARGPRGRPGSSRRAPASHRRRTGRAASGGTEHRRARCRRTSAA